MGDVLTTTNQDNLQVVSYTKFRKTRLFEALESDYPLKNLEWFYRTFSKASVTLKTLSLRSTAIAGDLLSFDSK